MNDVVEAGGEVVNADAPGVENSGPTGELHGTPERPEWLPEKFETPEALADSYAALEEKMRTKTDDFREEVRASMLDEAAGVPEGVPESAAGYEMPEGMEATSEELLETFQEWAFERELGQDDFNELVQFYADSVQPNVEAEAEKIGEQRLNDLNNWIGANIPEEHYKALSGIMTTAANVEVLEAIMKLTVPSSLPGQGGDTAPSVAAPKTKAEIMQLMATPAYMDSINRDPQVVEEVDNWFKANAAG